MTIDIDVTIPDKQVIETEASVNEIQTVNANISLCGNDHSKLINRENANQHPVSAITGLQGELDSKLEAETDPVYNADKPNIALKSEIPTALLDLSDDSTHRLVTDVQINDWNNKQDAGDYATSIELTNGLALKVDKIVGKGLSTEDYTTAEKNKLAGLENYILPSDVVQDADYVHTDNNFTNADKINLDNQSGVNTGDQDLSGYATIDEVRQAKNIAIAMAVVL